MSAIQPSIVLRIKPELVPERTYHQYGRQGELVASRIFQPLEYKDQTFDLIPSEYASIGDVAQLGDVIAEVVTTYAEFSEYSDLCVRRSIRVQFHREIKLET
jgi:hypothetical protein